MNKKLFNVRINDRKVVVTFAAIVFLGKVSSDVFTAFIPSDFWILAYKDFTCSDTRYDLSGTVSTAFSLLVKSYDGICLTISRRW